jgi:hypothetical protein
MNIEWYQTERADYNRDDTAKMNADTAQISRHAEIEEYAATGD